MNKILLTLGVTFATSQECGFTYIFKKEFCCNDQFKGFCEPLPMSTDTVAERECCQDFNKTSYQNADDMQWTCINPAGLVSHAKSGHLQASKGSLYEGNSVLNIVRATAENLILFTFSQSEMISRGEIHPEDAIASVRQMAQHKFSQAISHTYDRWSETVYGQRPRPGQAQIDWPMRHLAHDADEMYQIIVSNPLDFMQARVYQPDLINIQNDFIGLKDLGKFAQHALDRIVLWDAWLRTNEHFGPLPEGSVSLYAPDACCTEFEVVLSLYRWASSELHDRQNAPWAMVAGSQNCGYLDSIKSYVDEQMGYDTNPYYSCGGNGVLRSYASPNFGVDPTGGYSEYVPSVAQHSFGLTNFQKVQPRIWSVPAK